jgi:hypothetical protein
MFPTENQIVAAAIKTMTAAAAKCGFEPAGGCCAYFAPSAPGIVPPQHIGKVWAIMLFQGERDQYANAVAWGKAQGPLQAQVRQSGKYDDVVAEGRQLVASKQANGYRAGYAEMLAEFGQPGER